jgi:hypothetical protein
VRGVQVKMFGNDHDQKGIFFLRITYRSKAGNLAVYKRNASGIQAERKRDTSGTEAG